MCRCSLIIKSSVLFLTISLTESLPTKPSVLTNDIFGQNKIDHSVKSKYLPEKCKGGTVYNITDGRQLFDFLPELECIFRAAVIPPTKVPVGPLHGTLLNFADSWIMNPIIGALWDGKLTEKVRCNGSDAFIGWNNVAGVPHVPFRATLDKIGKVTNLHPLEIDDDIETLIYDYTADDMCPDFELAEGQTENSLIIRKQALFKNFFPFNQILDVLRLVGRQADGGAIFLGRLIWHDNFRSDLRTTPHAFFYGINYDQDVNPGFKSGDGLPPLISDFYHRQSGLVEAALILQPFDNLFSEPIVAVKKTAEEVIRSGRAFTSFLYDQTLGSRAECGRMKESFDEHRPLWKLKKYQNPYLLSQNESFHSHFKEL